MIFETTHWMGALEVSLEVGIYRDAATIRLLIGPTDFEVFNFKVFTVFKIMEITCMSVATSRGRTMVILV